MTRFLPSLFLTLALPLAGWARDAAPCRVAERPDEPSPVFRNVATQIAYVGDTAERS